MKKILVIFVLICYSCKSQDCVTVNDKLVAEFEKKLEIVKRMQKGDKVLIVEYRDALLYLTNTTGIMTRADYSSTIGYANEADYKHDMKVWKKWLKENSCIK